MLRVSLGDPCHGSELSIAGVIEDFINLEPLTDLVRSGWSINCQKLNYLETNNAELKSSPSFLAICEFVAVETMNRFSDLAMASLEKHTCEIVRYNPQSGAL